MRPFYDSDGITIYHGRCEDVLPALEPVDIVVTSPPYNMGLKPGGNGRGMYRPGATGSNGARFRDGYDGENDDALEQGAYDDWQRAVLAALWAKVRLGIFYNHRPAIRRRSPSACPPGPSRRPARPPRAAWPATTYSELGRRFGVSKDAARLVVLGRRWAHLSREEA